MNIPIVSKILDLFDKSADIAKEAVTDKDKQNELVANLEKLKWQTVYIAELNTKTVPWIDGLHKMGRQILNLIAILAGVVLALNNVEITPSLALLIGGGNAAYQVIKGPGK